MYGDRVELYRQIEELRESKVLVYVTGDRPGMETKIAAEVLDFFADHLDAFALPRRVSLVLYSRGGETLAGWTIANMIRQFCDDFEVLIPMKAHSAATLISLGANRIVMTKQATLGPIDPSVNCPLNPEVPGQPPSVRLPVSVEDVAGFFDLARQELKIKKQEDTTRVYLKLADSVHPLALGKVFRARSQIQMLAERLLRFHLNDERVIGKVISALCSESGSHDYTLGRREAKKLGLPIETPSDELYGLLKDTHDDVRRELELNTRFDGNIILGGDPETTYRVPRGLIESIQGGSHSFVSEGMVKRQMVQTPAGPMPGVLDQRTSEGWTHESP